MKKPTQQWQAYDLRMIRTRWPIEQSGVAIGEEQGKDKEPEFCHPSPEPSQFLLASLY